MMQAAEWENHEGTALITLDNPPVNALGHDLRAALAAAVDEAEADPAIHAIVIRAARRTFPAGADIREFGKPPVPPLLPDLCTRIEACSKPVVAALHGTALGGGLELALAAHARVALASTRLGFPEVALGLLPGAGGTQRTPRLIGAEATLRMMTNGRPIRAAEALALGLVDRVVEDDVTAAALALAAELAAAGQPPVPTRERTEGFHYPVAYEAAIATARKAPQNPDLPAPGRIIDCVEAALLLPFDAGLSFERAAFGDLVDSAAAKGLRHAFLAERRVTKIPEAGATPRAIAHVGVVGGGLMGAGILVALLDAGLTATLVERDADALTTGLERIATIHEAAVAKGRMKPERRDADWARLSGSTDLAVLAEADLVIEAVPEDEALKADLFRRLDPILKPGAPLATNTSYLDVNVLARVTSRPSDVLGLHFFSPANVMRLVEVIAGAETAPDAVATGFALAKRMGKTAVRAGVCDGFIGNRILTAYRTAADITVEDGATPYAVDAAMRGFGFPLGPYQLADRTGLDISWARRKRMAPLRDPEARYVAIADRLCEAGRLGQKTGAGWYAYPEGARQGQEDPAVLAVIAAERAAKGLTPQDFTADEIARRCLLAMIAEAARIAEEGIALRPSDIDVVMLAGYAFPRWRGGPMKAADLIGLLPVRTELAALAPSAPAIWTPPPILSELIKYGRCFDDLNGD
ncbi:MAG: 3-hydroxyacyl-CoA dehydrogenase [Rhodobacteraceae bacterium]|nr:3-hydroxyacyl-CoA dehydrogenase [Paracoccaceae bacterium]